MRDVRLVGRKAAVAAMAAMLLCAGASEAATYYTLQATSLNDGAVVNNAGVVAGTYNNSGSGPSNPPPISSGAYVNAYIYQGGVATNLGSLGGANSRVSAINDLSQVVGWSEIGDGSVRHAYLSDGGVMTDLGTLGGTESYAFGINNDGVIVGYSQIAGDTAYHAFRYENGVMTDIGPVDHGLYAFDINASGQITGTTFNAQGLDAQAYLYSGGTFTSLGSFGGGSEGHALNDAGVVVGASYFVGPQAHAFLSDGGPMHDLGTLGGDNSIAWDINLYGQVVGWADSPLNTTTAFLYEGGQMLDLNTLIDPNDPLFGFVQLTQANSINDAGQITVHGYNRAAGTQTFYLLTPVTSVPEPGAWALMIVGFGMCGAAVRQRRRMIA